MQMSMWKQHIPCVDYVWTVVEQLGNLVASLSLVVNLQMYTFFKQKKVGDI